MRKLLTFCGLVAVFSSLALAETWTGRLVDANCQSASQGQQNQSPSQQNSQGGSSATTQSCNATSSTTSFAIDVSGKMYKLDAESNSRVTAALKNRADRSANPNSTTDPTAGSTTAVNARVSGTLNGDTIKVDDVTVM